MEPDLSTPLTLEPAPAAPAPLEYGRLEQPPWRGRRFWRVVLGCAAVAGAVYVIAAWVVPTFERWQDLRRQRPLMAYRAPAEQVVFDSGPAMRGGSGEPAGTERGLHLPPQWHSRPKGLAEVRVTNLAFLHGRTSPGGNQRLIGVECLPDCEVVVAPVPGLTPEDRCLRFELLSIRPATWQRSASSAQSSMGGFRVLTTGRRFRLFAGQPDPADASHFTFDYECDGHRGTIDGYLRDDDTIDLKPRDGTLHYASVWMLWNPPAPPAPPGPSAVPDSRATRPAR